MFPFQSNEFEQVTSCGISESTHGELFTERNQFMDWLCKKADVRPFGFHSIRHLTASTPYEMGQPVSIIQMVLRHKPPNTTVQYLKTLAWKKFEKHWTLSQNT